MDTHANETSENAMMNTDRNGGRHSERGRERERNVARRTQYASAIYLAVCFCHCFIFWCHSISVRRHLSMAGRVCVCVCV